MKTSMIKQLVSITILLTFTTSTTFAQLPSFSSQLSSFSSGAEFFVGKMEGKPLIKVNIISGLKNTGVYHIPVDTNLAELISYAGGAVDGANLDSIRVRSEGAEKSLNVYDFYSLSDKNNKMPTFSNGDIVQIDVSKDTLARTALWVGILGTITTVTLSIMIYNKNN